MATPTQPPSLLFLWTDQQAADTIGAHGNPHVETPNLDRLAGESVSFRNAYCTHPICTPSRSSILTGQYPHTTGCTENNVPLPDHVDCFPELGDFDDYATAFMGKWHLGDEIFPQHGFDRWVSIEDTYRGYYGDDRDRDAHSDYHDFLVSEGFEPDRETGDGFRFFSRSFCAKLPEEYSKPAFLAREATRFIEEHRDEPFVLHVMFLEPHHPYCSPRDDQYDPDEIPLPENFEHEGFDDQPTYVRLAREATERGLGTESLDDDCFPGPDMTPADWRDLRARYYGLVSLVDTYVGEILDGLAAAGRESDTVTVFTSDHGEMAGSHGLWDKMTPFEEAIRVPLLLRVPGLDANGSEVTRPVSQIDLTPTLLDAMDQRVPGYLQGESWLPALRETGTVEKRPVVVEWNGPYPFALDRSWMRANTPRERLDDPFETFADCWTEFVDEDELREYMIDPVRTIVTPDGWKLNWRRHGEDELYDLDADPAETENRIDDPEHADRVEALRADLVDWQHRTRDPVYLV